MPPDRFHQTVAVGSRLLTIREESLGERERIVIVEGDGLRHSIRLLSCYEPSVTVIGQTVSVWGGTRLHAVNVGLGSTCHRDFDTGIVAVIPYGRFLLVITELEALLVDDTCEVITSLLTHREVILDAQLTDRRLSVRDLQGRVLSVDLPEL